MKLLERVLRYDSFLQWWEGEDIALCHRGLNRYFELPIVRTSNFNFLTPLFLRHLDPPPLQITISVHNRPTPNRLKIKLADRVGRILNVERGVQHEVGYDTYCTLRDTIGYKTVYIQVEYDE